MSKCVKKPESDGWCAVRLECYKELGWALFYLSYLHPDHADQQKERVATLCSEGSANNCVASLDYWKHFLGRIQAETENLC